MARRKKGFSTGLNYHEGLSTNQVEIILREFGFNYRDVNEFIKWMDGQTCPGIYRPVEGSGENVSLIGGVFEYDLFRWIEAKRTGSRPIWD